MSAIGTISFFVDLIVSQCYLSIPIIITFLNGLLWPIVHSYVTKERKASAAGVQKKDTELSIFLFPSILFNLSVYYTFNKDVFMSFYLHKYKKRIYIYGKRQKKLIWNKTNVNTTKSENYSSSALILFISFLKRIFFVGGYVSLIYTFVAEMFCAIHSQEGPHVGRKKPDK